MNLIFYHFNCSERLLKSHQVFLVPVVAACSQLLLKSVSKLFENVEWSNSLLRHFKIQTLLKINCSMAAISAFGVTQHSQIISLSFRNRIQCIELYQLHNSQALLSLRRGYYSHWSVINYCYQHHCVPYSSHNHLEIIIMTAFIRTGDVGKINLQVEAHSSNQLDASTFSTRQTIKTCYSV